MSFKEILGVAAPLTAPSVPSKDLPLHKPDVFARALADVLAQDIGVFIANIAKCGADLGATACYALVDRGLCVGALPCDSPQHPIALLVHENNLQFARLFEGTPEDELADQGPWLIECVCPVFPVA